MSDDELRALERDVAGPASRIRYAEALVRSGRAEDALAALLAGIEHPDVRRAAGRLAPRATPIEREPRLLWRYDRTMEDTGALHANAFAVAVSVHNISHSWPPYTGGAPESHSIHVLDPRTGVRRTRLSGYVCVGLVDEVVVCTDEPLDKPSDGPAIGFDSRNGAELWRLASTEDSASVHVVGRQLVRRTFGWSGVAAAVEAFSLEEPRTPPVESVAHVELPRAEPREVRIGPWTYSAAEDGVTAKRDEAEIWRFGPLGLAPTWDGHLVARGATLIGAYRRGGSVFCLG